MNRVLIKAGIAAAALIGLFVSVPMQAKQADGGASFIVNYAAGLGAHVVWGELTLVDGAPIRTWGIVSNENGSVLAAGVTFSMKIVESMPENGDGPAGAFASIQFPESVRTTTYLEHLEIQPEPHGHITSPLAANPQRNSVPHYDFHFYSIPEVEVFPIVAAPPPLPPVAAPLLPAGYSQPGGSIAQMGRHSAPWAALNDPGFLSADMIAGFVVNGTKMHFIEPMISQERLLQRENFELQTPMPQSFGRSMRYPTKCEFLFHGNSCTIVMSDFVHVQ